MKRRLFFVMTGLVLLLLLAGCGQAVNTDEPPKIVYGQDVCDRCGMIINEESLRRRLLDHRRRSAAL